MFVFSTKGHVEALLPLTLGNEEWYNPHEITHKAPWTAGEILRLSYPLANQCVSWDAYPPTVLAEVMPSARTALQWIFCLAELNKWAENVIT